MRPMKSRTYTVILVLIVLALIVLIALLTTRQGMENALPPPDTFTQEDRQEAERIIRARINSLSPIPPTLGARFEVETVEWDGRGTATVRYGDGESDVTARVAVQAGSGRVKLGEFVVWE